MRISGSMKFSLTMLFLLLFLGSLGGTAAQAATYGEIASLAGTPSLSGSRGGYNVTLIASQQTALTITATAASTATDNTGTRIKWSVIGDTGTTSVPTIVPTDGLSTLDATNTATCSIQFANPSASDRFTVTAQLVDAAGANVGANAVVRVLFVVPVPIAGVTLDSNTLSVRQGGRPVYLKAIPSPSTATGVSYTWFSKNPTVAAVTQMTTTSPDMALVTGAYPGYSTQVEVQALGYGNATYSATCNVTVVGKGEIADDMKIAPVMGTAGEANIIGLYAVDSTFVSDAYALTDTTIKASSGMGSSGTPRYLLTAAGIYPMPLVNVDRAGIMTALGSTNYSTTTVGALRFDLDFAPPMARGDMVPFVLAFKLDGAYYPDGKTAVSKPLTPTAFQNEFRLLKYFERNNKRYVINISDILQKKSANAYVKMTNDYIQLVPLVVFVDDVAPATGCDQRVGAQNEYGVKYDQANKLLFIYDGSANTKVEDPIVLERKTGSGGGGGGGGCSTSTGMAGAMLLLAAVTPLVVRRKKS